MKAIILVAGRGRRLMPYTMHRPKCLIEVNGATILSRQLAALKAVGCSEVELVVGYRWRQVVREARRWSPGLDVTWRLNSSFQETNTSFSLLLALRNYQGPFLYLNGDVLLDEEALARIVQRDEDAALGVISKSCGDEEVKVIVRGERVIRIGKRLEPKAAWGEFVGLGYIGDKVSSLLYHQLERLCQTEEGRNAFFEEALDQCLAHCEVKWVEVGDLPCMEIDTPQDLYRARQMALSSYKLTPCEEEVPV